MDTEENKDSDHISHALKHAFEHIEDLYVGSNKINYRVMTGVNALDQITNGFHNGDLVVVCGNPGVGKSAFALSLASSAATRYQENASVLMFSTQSTARQLALRSTIAGARGSYSDIPRGIIRDADWSMLCCSAGRLSDLNLAINDTVSTIEEVFIYGRERKRDHATTCLIVLDSLDSITGENPAEYSDALVKLKQLARELNVPVIVTSAIKTKARFRRFASDPLFALLKKYADVLMTIKRHGVSSDVRSVSKDDVSIEGGENSETLTLEKWHVKISVLKNKNGPLGSLAIDFLPQLSRFVGA